MRTVNITIHPNYYNMQICNGKDYINYEVNLEQEHIDSRKEFALDLITKLIKGEE